MHWVLMPLKLRKGTLTRVLLVVIGSSSSSSRSINSTMHSSDSTVPDTVRRRFGMSHFRCRRHRRLGSIVSSSRRMDTAAGLSSILPWTIGKIGGIVLMGENDGVTVTYALIHTSTLPVPHRAIHMIR